MSDANTLLALQNVVRHETSSRLQYIRDAFPWSSAAGVEAVNKLLRIAEADRAMVNSIAQFLARNRYPVAGAPSYPANFTALNFLSVAHLLPLLVDSVQGSIVYLEKTLPGLSGDGKTLIETMLTGKKKHLGELQSLQSANTAPAAS